MNTNWIITKSYNDNTDVEFYKFFGSSNEMKKKLLLMAQNSNLVKYSDEDDERYPESVNQIEFDIDTKTHFIMITDAYDETNEVYSAKALNDIENVPEEFEEDC